MLTNKRFILLFFVVILCSYNVTAQKTKLELLRWAADAEGNAPYIIPDPANPTTLIGFEVDIANEIAKILNMQAVFVQNQWDGLIPGLNNRNYDIAINGIEITDDRKQEINFSVPYYITYEQLVVLKDRMDINSLSDLKNKKAGALKGSLAERILRSDKSIKVLTYDGEVSALTDMANGRLDAVLCDAPIAVYYAEPDERFKLVGLPIGEVNYGIAIRKENIELLNKINYALGQLKTSGKLREILEEWNLWNYTMAQYTDDYIPSNTIPMKYQYYLKNTTKPENILSYLERYWLSMPTFAMGASVTLFISITSMLVAIIFGLFLAIARVYGPFFISKAAIFFIEVIRGTPLLIQLYFIYYATPNIGIHLPAYVAAIIGLGLNYAAYEAENYRAGLFSVPKGQMEAALSLGMRRRTALRFVILPQAVRLVIPPVTNDFISLLKDSSLVSIITIVELTKEYFRLSSTYFDFLGTGIIVAVIYLLLGLPFVRLSKYLENKFSIYKQKTNSKS